MTMPTRRRALQLLVACLALPRAASAGSAAPPRIAAIDWTGAEALLALGVSPCGVSDTSYYRERMREPALPPDVTDIGPFWEVNMELLAELRLDLILAATSNLISMPALRTIATVHLVPETVPPEGRYALGGTILRDVAALVGRETEGAAVIEAADRTLSRHAVALRNSERRPVFVLLPNANGRNAVVYGVRSLPDAVLARLGFANAFAGRTNAAGVATIGVETLIRHPDASILMVDIPSARRRVESAIARSALWQALEPVRAGRMGFVEGFYPFGGVPSALRLAESLVRQLTRSA